MPARLDLAVLESRWWTKTNDSVRGVFDMLAGILVGNPFGYHYEMFNTAESIKEMIPRIARTPDIHHIYIAAHGDEQAIQGAGGRRTGSSMLMRSTGAWQASMPSWSCGTFAQTSAPGFERFVARGMSRGDFAGAAARAGSSNPYSQLQVPRAYGRIRRQQRREFPLPSRYLWKNIMRSSINGCGSYSPT